jgi:hypothetical protein
LLQAQQEQYTAEATANQEIQAQAVAEAAQAAQQTIAVAAANQQAPTAITFALSAGITCNHRLQIQRRNQNLWKSYSTAPHSIRWKIQSTTPIRWQGTPKGRSILAGQPFYKSIREDRITT